MIDGNARDLMVHFVSPKKDLRGKTYAPLAA